jgi:hypothetical protein
MNLRKLKQVNCVEYVKRLYAAQMMLVRNFIRYDNTRLPKKHRLWIH